MKTIRKMTWSAFLVAAGVATVCSTKSVHAVETSLVDNTSWSVAAIDDGTLTRDSSHPTPWIFQKDGTFSAEGYWQGVWVSQPGSNALKVANQDRSGNRGTFEVTFLSPKWFIATQNGKLFRVGQRR